MVVFVAPFGIFLIWKNKMFPVYARIILSIISGIIFLFFLITLRGAYILSNMDTKSIPATENQSIVGEWEYNVQKSGIIGKTSNFKFEKDGKFKWLVLNKDLGGNVLIEGTYVLTSGTISFISGTNAPLKLSYSIQGDSMILDGLYFKKGSNLSYTPSATNIAPVPAPVPVPVPVPAPISIDLSAGKYVTGVDVPPGKYDITAISGTGLFFGRPGIVNEMMGTDSDHYIPSYKNAIFKNGNEIEITSNLVVNLTSK